MINKSNIQHICFDLDGTLVDSSETIYLATVAALKFFHINKHLPEKEFCGMIGMHFVDIFNKLGIQSPDFKEFITAYKSIYFDFIDTSKLYKDADEVLDYFTKSGIKTSLLTTKSQDQAEKIINYFDLNGKLNYIMGRRDGLQHKPSPEPLLRICNALDVIPGETLIVGDTELDIQCGKNANTKTCGVVYGYRTKEQIKNENPDLMISNLSQLKNTLS